jgi:hypothetical protein
MIAGIVMASVVTGVLVGWWTTMVISSAAISYSQQRMQRKVRYWQAETVRARIQAKAARLVRDDTSPPERRDWPQAG